MKRPSTWKALILAAFLLTAWNLSGRSTVSADNPTPTGTSIATSTPAQIASTPLAEPTQFPTVVRERTTPISTVIELPTSLPTAVSSPPPVHVRVIPSPAASISAAPQPSVLSQPSVAYPSPAELRQNARLRWGRGIPGSVRRWAFIIVPTARRYHLDPGLIAAVMTMESNGDPLALSPADARGLMQILHGPWDPRTNIVEGAHMLSELYAEFGDWRLTLAAYNAGPGAVISNNGIPPYRETHDYVIIVTYLWSMYSHRHLTFADRTRYRATLRDLRHFKDQEKKVNKLAKIAHVTPLAPLPAACPPRQCGLGATSAAGNSVDPFWPVGDEPDPLQQVVPPGMTGLGT
ncbi:MAG: transglycosylase SLT domain-containing protein [Chloroflexota bacterium]